MEEARYGDSSEDVHGSSVQEWTGSKWVIVEDNTSEEAEAVPLDPNEIRGEYEGQRVVVPGRPIKGRE